MFGFLKQRKPTQDPLIALIEKQTSFSVKGVAFHKNLIAASPNPETASVEAFIFNNWVSYYLISEELIASLSPSAPDQTKSDLRETIRIAIVSAARDLGLKQLEEQFSARATTCCGKPFYVHANLALLAYDDSVARHKTPSWHSAGIALHARCGIGEIAISDADYYMNHFLKETAEIFIGIEPHIRMDTKTYMKNRRNRQ